MKIGQWIGKETFFCKEKWESIPSLLKKHLPFMAMYVWKEKGGKINRCAKQKNFRLLNVRS
jgi:hypothetical protein